MKVFQEAVVFQGPVSFGSLPKEGGLVLIASGSSAPSVEGNKYFYYTGAAVNISNFKGGSDVHTIYLLGNTNITIVNGTNIKTNTGANKTLSANKVYTFHHINGVWYEVA